VRLFFITMLVMLWLMAIEGRLVWLQLVKHHEFSQQGERLTRALVKQEPRRGKICDRNGEELARTIITYSIFARPQFIKDYHSAALKLASILHRDTKELENAISQNKKFVWVARHISNMEVMNQIGQKRISGIEVVTEPLRYYPHGALACQTVGWVNSYDEVRSGIEYQFDGVLRGQNTAPKRSKWWTDEVVAARDKSQAWYNGANVYLTIDATLQSIAQDELRHAIEKTKAIHGSVIIQEPRTGEILAIVSWPEFNGNKPTTITGETLSNFCVSRFFEPGSTLKPFIATAILECGVAEPNRLINCENGVWKNAPGGPINDYRPNEQLTFREVVEHSSNIGMAKLGQELGAVRMYRCLRDFGFGNLTGIELPGETSGILRRPGRWSETSPLCIAFGQELAVTCVQLVNAFSSIANGGLLMEPYVVKRIVYPDGRIVSETRPHIARRVIKRQTASTVTEFLEGVVLRGSGKPARISGWCVAGKTGTAQKFDRKLGKYSHNRYVSSFVGFVPALRPELTILVVLDEPRGQRLGGVVAAPVFGRIARRAMAYWHSQHISG